MQSSPRLVVRKAGVKRKHPRTLVDDLKALSEPGSEQRIQACTQLAIDACVSSNQWSRNQMVMAAIKCAAKEATLANSRPYSGQAACAFTQSRQNLRQVTLVVCKAANSEVQHSQPLICFPPLSGVLKALTLLNNWRVLAQLCGEDQAKNDRLLLSLVDGVRLLHHVAAKPLPELS